MLRQLIVPPIALSLLLMLGSGKAAIATPSISQAEPVRSEPSIQPNRSPVRVSLPLFDRAIQVANAIAQPSAKIQALSTIALKLSQANQTQRSQQVFDRAIQLANQTTPDFSSIEQQQALRDISIQLAQAGQIQKSLQLVTTMTSEFRKAEALNDIATILVDRGQLQQAKTLLAKAAQFARGIHGDYAYESNGSCGNDKFEVLSKIAGSLSLLSQFDRALQIANSLQGCASATGEASQDYQAWAYLGILAHLGKIQQVKQTWSSAQTIQSPLEQSIAWSAIALKLIDLGETPLAQSIAIQITKIKVPSLESSPVWAARTFNSQQDGLKEIAVKLAQKRQFGAALQVQKLMTESPLGSNQPIDRLPQPSTKNKTLGEIAREVAIAGQVPQALTLVNQISDVEAKAIAQIVIAKELQKTGQTHQATQLLQNLTIPTLPKNPQDFAGYQPISRVAVALVTAGQRDRAIQIAQSIQNRLVQESTLTDIAVQQANLGQVDQALQWVKRVPGKGSQSIILESVIAKQIELGHLDRALKLASSLEASSPVNSKLLVKLAERFAQLKQRSQALQAAHAISNDELKATTLAEIAKQIPDTASKGNSRRT